MAHIMQAVISLRDNFTGTMARIRTSAEQHTRAMTIAGRNMQNMGKKMGNVGSKMTKSITLPVAAIGAASVKTSIESEKAFAGVRKTVNATEKQYASLRKGLDKKSLKIPIDKNELYGIAESAGQLGVARKDVLGFTTVVGKISQATNMTSEQAATDFAQFANITKLPLKNVDRLGSTVVHLGNNLATTESDIMSMSMRLAGTGSQVGMSQKNILGLAGAMASVGINAEAGGSSMSKTMQRMNTAVTGGGKKLEMFAKIAGKSTTEFAKQFKAKPEQAILSFTKGLDKIKKSGGDVTGELKKLGINSIQEIDTLNRLSGNTDLLSKSLKMGNEAWAKNSALNKEAAENAKTNAAQITMMKNQLKITGDIIGPIIIPHLVKIVKFVGNLAKKFGELSPKTQKLIVNFFLIAAAIGPVLSIGGKILTVFGGAAKGFGTFINVLKMGKTVIMLIGGWIGKFVILLKSGITTIIAGIKGGFAALNAFLGPIGWIIIAVVALVTAFVILYKKNEAFRTKVQEIWTAIKTIIAGAVEGIKQIWASHGTTIMNTLKTAWAGISQVFITVFTVLLQIIQGFISAVQAVWPVLSIIIGTVINVVSSYISGLVGVIQGIITFLTGVFTGNWSQAWDGIVQIFSSIFGTIKSVASGIINGVIGIINKGIGALNKLKVPDWVPGVGGKGVNIPKIPKLAKGTSNWQGGIVQVHEAGGEIIDLPGGSRVYPHDKSVDMARKEGLGKGSVSTTNKTYNIEIKDTIVREEADIDKIVDKLVKKLEIVDSNMPTVGA